VLTYEAMSCLQERIVAKLNFCNREVDCNQYLRKVTTLQIRSLRIYGNGI
jgi:hypothetical protein